MIATHKSWWAHQQHTAHLPCTNIVACPNMAPIAHTHKTVHLQLAPLTVSRTLPETASASARLRQLRHLPPPAAGNLAGA